MIIENITPSSTPTTDHKCRHCGLPVPLGLIEATQVDQFCCHGCRTAFQLIHSSGLESFYRMVESDSARQTLQKRDRIASRFSEMDEAVFLKKYATQADNTTSLITLALDGIHCGACVWLLEKLPTIAPGVLSATVNWSKGTVAIRWQIEQIKLSQIATTLHRLGYSPSPIRESESSHRFQRENRRHLSRIGIAAAAAGNNMIISAALYLGMFSYMSSGMSQMFRVASCLAGVLALLWPGRIFLQGAISAIRTRTPHMDLPIALGLSVGTLAGVINVIRGTGEIYFDSLSVLIFLLLVGRWIQFRQQSRAADSVEMLYRLTPQRTRKLVDGQPVETSVDLIQKDDELEILSGDLFPVDGEILHGSTQVDESILSGESRWLDKGPGQSVSAGTINETSVVTIRAIATGADTRLSKIVELVEQASLDKPLVVQWADRIGGHFVLAVIALACVTLFSWIWFDVDVAVERTVALLIVACPCALALATPLAISVAIGRAARQRIMIKGGDVLQSLRQPGMIWLDKTGTLTEGHLTVSKWFGDTRWLPTAAALEGKSTHPVARAIVDFANDTLDTGQRAKRSEVPWFQSPQPMNVVDISEHTGLGMEGVVDGRQVLIGSENLFVEQGVKIARRHQRRLEQILQEKFSPCLVAVDGAIVAIAALGDRIRKETCSAIDQLKSEGWKVGILSGDHPTIVKHVAKQLSIEESLVLGGVSPEQKVEVIQRSLAPFHQKKKSNESQTVIMVGDGVNDSAALAAASVGIAVKNGAEASLAAAPVYLGQSGLEPILKLIAISQSTGRTMRKNLAISLCYNLGGASLAFFGFINPLVAAILMPISSLSVVALSLTSGATPKEKAKQ